MPEIKQLEVAMVHTSNLSERFLYDLIKYTRGFYILGNSSHFIWITFSRFIKRNVTNPLECQISDIHVQVIQASCNMSAGGSLKNREEQSKKLEVMV